MLIEGKEIVVRGKFPRVARVRAEYYEYVNDARSFVADLKKSGTAADVLSFLQETVDRTPQGGFYHVAHGIQGQIIIFQPKRHLNLAHDSIERHKSMAREGHDERRYPSGTIDQAK